MNRIQHLVEPHRLFLAWQRPVAGMEHRSRRIVGEIERRADGAIFRYLENLPDYQEARREGFQGFPAFSIGKGQEYTSSGVLKAFMRRLPPRKREDFSEYLAQFRLPIPFDGSDMALLAYTGAKLPGDGFEIIPDLADALPPIELVMELAGFRHQAVSASSLSVGESVTLVAEPDNPADPDAIAVRHRAGRIGYIAKPYCATVANWLRAYTVEASIERINGKPERPLVYLFVKIVSKAREQSEMPYLPTR